MTRIKELGNRIAELKNRLAEDITDDERIDVSLALAEAEEQLNFAWQDDESDYNYAIERQEFNADGSLKYYD